MHVCMCVYKEKESERDRKRAFYIHGNQESFILKEKEQYFHWIIQ